MLHLDTHFSGRSVLVTGGSGFIGTHLVSELTRLGANVINLDIAPPTLPEHARLWTQGDFQDVDLVQRLVSEKAPEIIYNLAAVTQLGGPPSELAPNFRGLQVITDVIRKSLQHSQLVHFSTQMVVRPGYQPRDMSDLMPYTSYGESKAEGERLLRRTGSDCRWTIVRPAAIWGPYHRIYSAATWRYVAKRYYLLAAGADALRAFGYVRNLVEQVLRIAILPAEKVDAQTFYIADRVMYHSEWIDAFSIALTGKPARRVPRTFLWSLAVAGEATRRIGISPPFDLGRLQRLTTDYAVPIEGSQAVLGAGETKFADGVAETVRWLRGSAA